MTAPVETVRDPKNTMKWVVAIALIAAAALVACAMATPVFADGKDLFTSKQCVTCHQPGGKGTGPFPKLAGKDKAFLQEQFLAIQSGTRTTGMSATMKNNPGVKSVTAEEIAAIAEYLSALQ